MAGLVDITLPSGEAATVPQEDLSRALAAGATQAGPAPAATSDDPAGGLLGQAAAGVFGAGSTGTFGLSDSLLSEGSYLLGGKQLHRQVLGEVTRVKQANPGATMAGEAAGLFVNPGISHLGEAVEQQVASRAGEGLLGSVASMGARGAAEGATLGAQHQITEDALGDHEYNGEALFASAAKDALLGGAFGAGLGAAGYGLGKLGGVLRRSPGPVSDATLDQIAGVEGAGRQVERAAAADEATIEGLRKTGMTSDQASQMLDHVDAIAKNSADAGAASGAIDDAVESYIAAQAKANPERADVIRQAWRNKTTDLHAGESEIEQHGLRMTKSGTEVARVEQELGNIQFRDKSEQFARLVDPTKLDAQADQVASILQDADQILSHWEGFESRGVRGHAVGELRKVYGDTLKSLQNIGEGSENASRDLMIRVDKMKRAFDRSLQWGRENRFNLPEAITSSHAGLEDFTNRMRSALEDTNVWGEAGAAQARWNSSFSQFLPRGQHFAREMRVSIDAEKGVALPEVDFEKTMGMLRKLNGSDTDAALQSVKSTEAYISGMRDRIGAIKQYAELTPQQSKLLDEGLTSLKQFEGDFRAARQKAAVTNRLKQSIAEERDAGHIGGLIGLAADAITKPLTTVQRIAHVQQTVRKLEDSISGGLRKFFGGDGESTLGKLADAIKPRDKAKVAQEIGDIAELRGNPAAMQARADKMVGDLGSYAPKTANEVKLTSIRALDYLAREAPRPAVPIGLLALDLKNGQKARYSDQQISEWETKRQAALDPQSVVRDMQRGKLNRDAIQAVEFVSPRLFAKMQELAQEQIHTLAAQGKLGNMPYQQRAVIATLLKVPPDATWRGDFISMMQAAKAAPEPKKPGADGGPPQANAGVSKRAVKVDSSAFATATDNIEQGRAA